jgi:hypothetical protein
MLALYLLTCPHANMLGIYYLPIAYIVHDAEMNTDAVTDALEKLNEIGFCTYDDQAEYVWVHEMAIHQISDQLEERDKRVKAVNDIYHSLPELIFLNNFYKKYKDIFHLQPRKEESSGYQDEILDKNPTTPVVNEENHPFEGASKALRSQEQEQEQEQEQKQEQEQEEEQEQEGKHRRSLRHRQGYALEKTELPAPPTNSPLSFVIGIPLRDDSEFFITQVMFDEWQQLYPSVDVLQLLKNIRGWNLANPNKRKTRKGILQHINQWLAKENSKPDGSSILEKPGGGFNLFDHNTQVANAWLDQNGSFMERELVNEGE